ncbi:hypothetical protein SLA2020_139680 [Shorea laevis]
MWDHRFGPDSGRKTTTVTDATTTQLSPKVTTRLQHVPLLRGRPRPNVAASASTQSQVSPLALPSRSLPPRVLHLTPISHPGPPLY